MISIKQIDELLSDIKRRLNEGIDAQALRQEVLSRNGTLATLSKSLPELQSIDRAAIGKRLNEVKTELIELLKSDSNMVSGALDLTLPATLPIHGHEHPVQHTIAELYQAFGKVGFSTFLTPEIDSEEHNFDSLRVAKDHPARDMQDTFWTTDGQVLRTHTTAFQSEALGQLKPPFAVMQGGKIYRAEAEDATHLSEFHNFDCFAVAPNLTFADLKGILYFAIEQLFGSGTHTRFRPSFFPFVEPGAEMDMQCPRCKGKGCKSCGHKGWLEMFGCGMTHPDILTSAGIDPLKYHGIAWGIGVERISMLRYGVDDIREFSRNDPRFLEQLT